MLSTSSLLVGVALLLLAARDVTADDVIDSWGLDDRMAAVGRLFEYQLRPTSADNTRLKVQEAGSDVLPSWLSFDSESGKLEGVPSSGDLRKTFSISVMEPDTSGKGPVDVFDISVVDEIAVPEDEILGKDEKIPRPIRCLPGSAITTATIVIDTDMEKLSGRERAAALRALGSHLDLPVAGLRILPSPTPTLADSSALVAGAGNIAAPNEKSAAAILQWEVGCGNVFAVHMDVLQRVESTALDGKMAQAIGHGIIGWHVANKKPAATRLRRQAPRVNPTSTPTIGVTPPTARPVPTRTIVSPGPTKLPPTRVVPTTPSSPPEIQPTRVITEKPHRTKTGGRHFSTTRPTKPTRRPRTTKPVTDVPPITTPIPSAPLPFPGDELEPSFTITPSTKFPIVATPPLDLPKVTPKMETPAPPVIEVEHLRCIQKPSYVLHLLTNDIVDYKIPVTEFFYSSADADDLSLKLVTSDGMEVSHWLKLDPTSNSLVGMPLNVVYLEYTLQATDPDGHTARCELNIEVRAKPATAPNSVFEATAKFDIDYARFTEDVALRIDVANKLAGAFGDPDASQLVITSVAPGSVKLGWTNSSVTGDSGSCPAERVADIKSRMFEPDGSLRESFREALEPYEIVSASMTPRGACSVNQPTTTVEYLEPKAKTASADNTLATVVVPILIIIIVVVVAAIIACLLYRRRLKQKKATSPDKSVKHGAPVIFAYELDDAATSPPSKPLIGSNGERPPAPPNYQLATTSSTPPMADHRRPLLADPSADQMSPLKYHPPPGSAVRPQGGASQHRMPPAYQST